jgi:ABC-type Zn uptake system ZnuABC Zn-binding protein ZnuA
MGEHLVPALAEALAAALPDQAAGIAQRRDQLQADLAQLDREVEQQLAALTSRQYVAAHPAWRYYNERYGLDTVATVEAVGGTEPSAAWLRQVVETARRARVKAIFTEVQISGQLTQTVAAEAGLTVGVLDPLGGQDVAGRDSYQALMRYNTAQFVQALGEDGGREQSSR